MDIGFPSLKKNGMKFNLYLYEIEDYGQLFLMDMKTIFGLMKMETAILVINNKDIPLINFDYVKAFNKDTFIFELYKTMLNEFDPIYLNELNNIKYLDNDLKDYELINNWYDELLYEESYRKKGKMLRNRYRLTLKKYLDLIIKIIKESSDCDIKSKREKIDDFANKLYVNGGPAVDMFKKLFGLDVTKKVILNYMYGIKNENGEN